MRHVSNLQVSRRAVLMVEWSLIVSVSLALIIAVAVRSAQAIGMSQTASFTLDNVTLSVEMPTLPSQTFMVSAPTSAIEAASSERTRPFSSVSIMTVPFGTQPGDLGLPTASHGGAPGYAQALAAAEAKAGGPPKAGPQANLFGTAMQGTVSRFRQRLPGTAGTALVDSVQWVTEAGNRLWVMTTLQQVSGSSSSAGGSSFGTGLVVSSPNANEPTTIGESVSPSRTGQGTAASAWHASNGGSSGAVPLALHDSALPQTNLSPLSSTASRDVPWQWPGWWIGVCNVTAAPPGYLLTTGTGALNGLEVCAPSSTQLGGGVHVSFFQGDTVGANQWQCVELSLRYMYQLWNVYPYLADGYHMADYFPFSTHPEVQEIQNNGVADVQPQPGDVIQMSDYSGSPPGPGHTGVVESVNINGSGSGSLTMLSENGNTSGRETLWVGTAAGLSAWVVGGDGVNYTTAWLHDANFASNDPSGHIVAGDFEGGTYADVMQFYNYPGSETGAWYFAGNPSGLTGPVKVWDSGAGNWDWDRIKLVAGDFTGYAYKDIIAFYDYGGARTGAWLFRGSATIASGMASPTEIWDSGQGGFEWSAAQFVVGDFNSDGYADVTAFYNNGNADTTARFFEGFPNGISGPVTVWDSGVGNWDWSRIKAVATDVNGDAYTDVVVFFNYGNAQTKAWLFAGSSTGIQAPTLQWDSGVGNWDWSRSKFVADFFTSGAYGGVMCFYNYPNSETGAWSFSGGAAGLGSPTQVWDSGAGNWDWNRI